MLDCASYFARAGAWAAANMDLLGAQSNIILVLRVKTRRLVGLDAVFKIRNEWDLTMGPHRTRIQ
jgi:hypothetical protein